MTIICVFSVCISMAISRAILMIWLRIAFP